MEVSVSQEIEDALADYAAKAEAWDSLVFSHAARANPIFDQLHHLAKPLRGNLEWRAGLERLTRSETPGVRLLAAAECLVWNPALAEEVLTELMGTTTLHAVTAKYTLREFRAGKLNLDW
jgi:hypothetical protein